jgi:hypothetical protein
MSCSKFLVPHLQFLVLEFLHFYLAVLDQNRASIKMSIAPKRTSQAVV